MAQTPNDDKAAAAQPGEHGEGNYAAGRAYQQEQHEFVAEHGDEIEGKAREAAAALDGEEAEELARAEEEGRTAGQS